MARSQGELFHKFIETPGFDITKGFIGRKGRNFSKRDGVETCCCGKRLRLLCVSLSLSLEEDVLLYAHRLPDRRCNYASGLGGRCHERWSFVALVLKYEKREKSLNNFLIVCDIVT